MPRKKAQRSIFKFVYHQDIDIYGEMIVIDFFMGGRSGFGLFHAFSQINSKILKRHLFAVFKR